MLKPVMADFDCASCGHGMECESVGLHDQDLYYSFFESYFRVRKFGLRRYPRQSSITRGTSAQAGTISGSSPATSTANLPRL